MVIDPPGNLNALDNPIPGQYNQLAGLGLHQQPKMNFRAKILHRLHSLFFLTGFLLLLLIGTSVPTTAVAASVPSGFSDILVAGGSTLPTQFQLNTPISVAFLPDGRLLVTEKAGKLRLIKNNSLQAAPALDITTKVTNNIDAGLISLAIDPNFASNGFIYLLYINKSPAEGHLSRFKMTGDTVDPASEAVLLTTISDNASHQVDDVRFGPGNTIYVSNGDSGPYDVANAANVRAQDPTKAVGKIYRITTSGQGLSTNPFWTGNGNDPASKVFALGLRNPFRFTVLSDGSVIVGDVGWNDWEEINRIPVSGGNRNLGWPCYEGGSGGSVVQPAFNSFATCQTLVSQGAGAVIAPSFAYNHSAGSSVTGGPVYTHTAFPSPYRGSYFFGDYSFGWINYWPLDANNNFVGQPTHFASVLNPVDLEVGLDGALYYVSISAGELHKIVYSNVAPPPPAPTPPPPPPPSPSPTPPPPPASACPVGQYLASYYTNTGWSGVPQITRCETTINNAWGTSGPFGASPIDNFSVSWSGSQNFAAGTSTLTSTSDDGMQVFVDGQLVIDNGGFHADTTKTATLNYSTAGTHTVLIKFFEATGFATAKFSIAGSTTPPPPTPSPTPPPPPSSGCPVGQYSASYYANTSWSGTPQITRCETTINNAWGTSSPFGASPIDNFSISWIGDQNFSAGVNTLSSTSDDGMYVYVDGQLVLDNGGLHGDTTKTVTLNYSTAGTHTVLVKFFEATGYATAKFSINGSTSSPPPAPSPTPPPPPSNKPPVPQITAPVDGSGFGAYQVISVQGSATDPESGSLTGNALVWNIILHHCPPPNQGVSQICHTHPETSFTGSSGSFQAPDTAGDTIWLEIVLTASDPQGANASTKVQIWPNFCPVGSYQGLYYRNQTWTGTPAISRCDSAINNDWANYGPFAGGPLDSFSINWHNRQLFKAGTSTLTATSDDGMQVYVDGQLTIDHGGQHSASPRNAQLTFPQAGYHDVLVHYFEAQGDAVAKFTIQ